VKATGETSIEQKGEELDYLLKVASGRKSGSEQLGAAGTNDTFLE
jgi:altronate dehydratase